MAQCKKQHKVILIQNQHVLVKFSLESCIFFAIRIDCKLFADKTVYENFVIYKNQMRLNGLIVESVTVFSEMQILFNPSWWL